MLKRSSESTERGGRLDCHQQKHLPALCLGNTILDITSLRLFYHMETGQKVARK